MVLDFGPREGRVGDACGWRVRERERRREGDRARTAHAPSTEDIRRPPSGCGNRRSRSRGTRLARVRRPQAPSSRSWARHRARLGPRSRLAGARLYSRETRPLGPSQTRRSTTRRAFRSPRARACAKQSPSRRNFARTENLQKRAEWTTRSKATTPSSRPSQRWSPHSPRVPPSR